MYLTRNLSKSPFYQVLYKNENGKFTTFSTGKKSKSDALKALADFKDTLSNKSDYHPITLKEFESEYLVLVKSIRSKSYIRSIESSFKKLYEYAGNVYLNKLDHKTLERFITSNYNDSKFAAALYYRTLKAAFEKAREWNYIQENPLKKFRSPKLPKTLPIFINITELNKILKHTDTRLMKDLFLTAFYTGLRLGELVNLKWTAIDLKRRMIKVQNTNQFTTKNKKERIIPVNDTLNKIILNRLPKNNHSNNSEYVFSKVPGILLNTDYVSKTFKKAVRKSGLNNKVHFHSLRHSFASTLVQNGISLYLVKELLGHQDIITTQIYAHIKNENLFDAVKVFDKKISTKKERG